MSMLHLMLPPLCCSMSTGVRLIHPLSTIVYYFFFDAVGFWLLKSSLTILCAHLSSCDLFFLTYTGFFGLLFVPTCCVCFDRAILYITMNMHTVTSCLCCDVD